MLDLMLLDVLTLAQAGVEAGVHAGTQTGIQADAQAAAPSDTGVWFTERQAGLWGGILGGGFGGIVCGGIGGGVCGPLAAKGIGRRFVLTFYAAMFFSGLLCLSVGLVALFDAQPWYVYFVFLQLGFIVTLLSACLYPVMRARFAQAERRKLDAEQIRRSPSGPGADAPVGAGPSPADATATT